MVVVARSMVVKIVVVGVLVVVEVQVVEGIVEGVPRSSRRGNPLCARFIAFAAFGRKLDPRGAPNSPQIRHSPR